MEGQIPQKVPYEDYVKSTNMFFVDAKLEEGFEKEIRFASDTLCTRMSSINSEKGLEDYIREDKDSLENLISIMNISSEKFKRVITTLRLEKGHSISGEWDLAKIRTMMIERPAFMSEVCHLLRDGANDPKYQSMIPTFYLENFVIDDSTMARLSNPDDLRRLIKKGIEGKYNIRVGSAYVSEIEKHISQLCFNQGLTYECNKEVPILGRTFNFSIPNAKKPTVVISASYNITTSSTQTRYKEAAESASTAIREYNNSHDRPIALVNILDGAGWVGRQSDLRAIHLCSTYMLHLSTMDQLDSILRKYC